MAQSSDRPPFSSFNVLTFDIYGTLIDWESGIFSALSPLVSHPDRTTLLHSFNEHERRIQSADPGLKYSDVLAQCYLSIAKDLNTSASNDDAKRFAQSIAHWPAFPDSVDAMQRLYDLGYELIALSNVDRDSFSLTLAGPLKGVAFNEVYTAEDIGSYKPDLRNFEYMLRAVREDFGQEKEKVLHVANSLFHDHVPAKEIGLKSVWIARGQRDSLAQFEGKVAFGWRYETLGEFADAVEKEREDAVGKEREGGFGDPWEEEREGM